MKNSKNWKNDKIIVFNIYNLIYVCFKFYIFFKEVMRSTHILFILLSYGLFSLTLTLSDNVKDVINVDKDAIDVDKDVVVADKTD